jgi:DNA-binding FrmR family transcriptional regulator
MSRLGRDDLDELVQRMRRIEGQARGIQRMLASHQDCRDILIQLAAMRAGLGQVGAKTILCHVGHKMSEEIGQGGRGEKALREAIENFLRLT